MKNKNMNQWLVTTLVAILVGGAAFWGGMKYQQTKQPNFTTLGNGQFGGRAGQNRAGNTAPAGGAGAQFKTAGFRPVNGEILSQDANSITVKLADGSSKIVLLSDSTAINKADTASKTDLKVGEKVAVFGTTNTDGSVTAQNIQLNPVMMTQSNDSGPVPPASPMPTQ